jgi:uncharacterized membrane protein YphA (DoxX/SURF4 family)
LVEALNRAADQEFAVGQVVRASAVTQVVAGGLIASSLAPRLGAVASLAATLPAALFGYRFWEMDDADQRARARRGFFAHIALVGAALLILSSPVGRRRRDEAGGQRRRPARCGRRAKAAKAAQTA